MGIFNPLILDIAEKKVSEERINITIPDLIEVSEFKLHKIKNLLIVYISYPELKIFVNYLKQYLIFLPIIERWKIVNRKWNKEMWKQILFSQIL